MVGWDEGTKDGSDILVEVVGKDVSGTWEEGGFVPFEVHDYIVVEFLETGKEKGGPNTSFLDG